MKIVILIVILLLIVYAAIENILVLSVRREKLGNGIRIAHISDLHRRRFGRDNERLCRKVRELSPDVIIISGDFVSRRETDLTIAEKTLASLCMIAPVYMILGNHEQSLSPEIKEKFIEMTGRNGAVLLRNASADFEKSGRHIRIFGLEESYETYLKNNSYRDLEKLTVGSIKELIGECPEGEVILTAHNPLFGEVYSEWGADYVLSGHVHGGSVRVFGVGLLSPERKFFPKYSKGIYTIGKTKLLVSAGLGKPRLFDPPEIVVYDI